MSLTPKQRRFVDEYQIDLCATQAAIRAGYSERTAAEQGYKLLQKPSVQAAIQDRQVEIRERLEVSVESISHQLQKAYDQAAHNSQASAMVQASLGLAKLHGLLVDRTEDVTQAQDMTREARAAELARVQAELAELLPDRQPQPLLAIDVDVDADVD